MEVGREQGWFAGLKYWWTLPYIRLGFRREIKLEYSNNAGSWRRNVFRQDCPWETRWVNVKVCKRLKWWEKIRKKWHCKTKVQKHWRNPIRGGQPSVDGAVLAGDQQEDYGGGGQGLCAEWMAMLKCRQETTPFGSLAEMGRQGDNEALVTISN